MIIAKECSGCGACSNICPKNCIEFVLDKEGFLFPKVDEDKCVKCGKCEKVCPMNQNVEPISTPIVLGAFTKDDSLRYESSSGGVFSEIACAVLNQGGYVCGVEFDSENQTAKHIIIDKIEELYKLRGSKYIQSDIGNIYLKIRELLLHGKKVLFSGTPCQVAGLRSCLGSNFSNLVCVEVICHGVPPTGLWKKYVQHVERKEKKRIEKVFFRSKKYSWNDFGVNTEYWDFSKKFQFSFENPFFRVFNSNLCLRETCYNCKFKGLSTRADIALGDFWHVEEIDANLDDGKGISIVLLCTNKGKILFKEIVDKLNICIENVDYEKACKLNAAINKSMPKSDKRDQFLVDMNELSFNELSKKYFSLNVKQKLKGVLIRTGLYKVLKSGGQSNMNYGMLIEFVDRR